MGIESAVEDFIQHYIDEGDFISGSSLYDHIKDHEDGTAHLDEKDVKDFMVNQINVSGSIFEEAFHAWVRDDADGIINNKIEGRIKQDQYVQKANLSLLSANLYENCNSSERRIFSALDRRCKQLQIKWWEYASLIALTTGFSVLIQWWIL
ncbi:MAG: hypothetical protein HOL31_02035 [Candidatus Scalindua sp.]|nr:hypothetical protein [Candidatus Scalindua sp.]MBT7349681.1 hypothetical protein [candidate division WWE3 bacterium]